MKFLQLLRVKDWIKNLFMFLHVFFAGEITDLNKRFQYRDGTLAFSLDTSSIYVLNDYNDIEDDSKHPVKKNRPLAAKLISISTALLLASFTLAVGMFLSFKIGVSFFYIVLSYIVLTISYC